MKIKPIKKKLKLKNTITTYNDAIMGGTIEVENYKNESHSSSQEPSQDEEIK